MTDENGKRITYKYDGMGQLIRENNPYANLTTVYSYDKGGNITSAKEYAYTTAAELGTVKKTYTYTYEDIHWKDKLTSYNGEAITYDEIGNPLTYRDSLPFTWKNGRQLASLQNGSSVINYTYNADGVRIGKSGSRAGTFIVSGTQILREINSVATIDYLYDENGSPIGLTYKGKTYYYRKNLQGDIINITDSTGAKVVTYTYNAWGKIMSMTGNMELAVNNPFRYRGYYYDVESGLYYLNSRYYDPQTGRFINADAPEILDGGNDHLLENNLFAYCFNDPVNRFDDSGNWSLPNWAKIAIGAAAIAVGVIATAATGGAAAPVLVASLKIAATSAAIGAVSGAGINAVSHRMATGSWKGAGKAAVRGAIDGACDGFMWGGITAGATFTTVAAKGAKIQNIGKLKPKNKSGKGYRGVQYKNKRGSLKSFELHSPHKGGNHQKWHWQQNTWNPQEDAITGSSIHWTLFGRRF